MIPVVFFFGGCCHAPRPVFLPERPTELVDSLRAVGRELPTIRGELHVDHEGPEGRIAGRVYAFASRGGRLRLEAVSPLDTPLQTIAVDGQDFALVDHDGQRCLSGPARPCLVAEAVGLELSAAQVGSALVGVLPLLRHGRVEGRWNRCGHYELELEGERPGWRQHVELEPRGGRLVATSTTITGPDGPLLEMTLGDYRPAGDRLIPRRIRVRMPGRGTDLRIAWRELETDVQLPEAAWRVVCPAGFTQEEARCESEGPAVELEPPGGVEAPTESLDGEPSPSGEAGAETATGTEGREGAEESEGSGDEPDLDEELGL